MTRDRTVSEATSDQGHEFPFGANVKPVPKVSDDPPLELTSEQRERVQSLIRGIIEKLDEDILPTVSKPFGGPDRYMQVAAHAKRFMVRGLSESAAWMQADALVPDARREQARMEVEKGRRLVDWDQVDREARKARNRKR